MTDTIRRNLSRTEYDTLASAIHGDGKVCVVESRGCGVKTQAVRSLIASGLMVEISCHAKREVHRGRVRISLVTDAAITDAGRSAMEA